jgi:hypothetical protein
MQSLALVVMEPGSEWPERVGRYDADVVVFGQAKGETDDALLGRVRRRVELGRDRLELAVLACNNDKNPEAMDRREIIAQALLDGVLRARRGHLVFSASAGASPGLQQQLLALTATVLEGMASSSACVSVRFESGKPEEQDGRGSYEGTSPQESAPVLLA